MELCENSFGSFLFKILKFKEMKAINFSDLMPFYAERVSNWSNKKDPVEKRRREEKHNRFKEN